MAQNNVRLTLLITTFNRATLLERSLRRLLRIGTIPDEILIVDDGSQDHTRQVCETFKEILPIAYIYRDYPFYDSCAIPRNIGVKRARGEYLMHSEPEILFVTDVIAQAMTAAAERPNEVISQGVIYHMGETTPYSENLITDPARVLREEWDVRPYPEHYVANFPSDVVTEWRPVSQWVGLYRREWLLEVGGWDEDFSLLNNGFGYAWDDIDLLTRLRIKGHNQYRVPDMSVIHQWHDKNGANLDGVWQNEVIIKRKQLGDENGYEAPHNPNLIANRGREWGKL